MRPDKLSDIQVAHRLTRIVKEQQNDPSARPQTGPEESNSRAAAGNRPIWRFRHFLAGFWPRDWSQTLGNGRRIHLGGFSRPGDHSGPISDHFRRFRARPPLCDLSTQLTLLRHQHCALRHDRCLSAETGQMFSAETRQM